MEPQSAATGASVGASVAAGMLCRVRQVAQPRLDTYSSDYVARTLQLFDDMQGPGIAADVADVASNRKATGVRDSVIIAAARDNEFVLIGTYPFLDWRLRDYPRSYGDRRD